MVTWQGTSKTNFRFLNGVGNWLTVKTLISLCSTRFNTWFLVWLQFAGQDRQLKLFDSPHPHEKPGLCFHLGIQPQRPVSSEPADETTVMHSLSAPSLTAGIINQSCFTFFPHRDLKHFLDLQHDTYFFFVCFCRTSFEVIIDHFPFSKAYKSVTS